MPRPGYFSVTLPERVRGRLNALTDATGHSTAWVVELLIVSASPADVVRPDAMLLTVSDHRPPAPQPPAMERIDEMLAEARSRLLSFEARVAELEAQRAAALQRLAVAQE